MLQADSAVRRARLSICPHHLTPDMRILLRSSLLVPCLALVAAGCGLDGSSSVAPNAVRSGDALRFEVPPPPPVCLATTTVMPPLNADGSSVYELRRTIPVKIRVVYCDTQLPYEGLSPHVSLASVAPSDDQAVNELESSSAADDGTTMRGAGNGQYIFNLSTKTSQFNAGQDLVPGHYQLTISSPGVFADIVVQFALRR